jgi:hypothetical protein
VPDERPEKCPFCGASVEDEGPVCRECGFEFGTEWTPPDGEEAAFQPGLRACPSCGTLNPVGRDFCSECSAPVGEYASVKPFERIWSLGFVYRRAAEGETPMSGPARIGRICLGVFLLSNPAIALCFFLAEGMSGGLGFPFEEDPPLGAVWMALLAIPMLVMGYLGLRLLGVRFGAAKETPDEPRPLRQPQEQSEPDLEASPDDPGEGGQSG